MTKSLSRYGHKLNLFFMLFYNNHLFAWTVNQWSLIWDNDVLFCSTQQLPHPCLQPTTFTFWSRHGVLQGPWNSPLALLLDLQISGQCRVFWLGCKGPRTLSKTNLDGVFVKSTFFFTVPWWQSNLIELSKWPDMFFPVPGLLKVVCRPTHQAHEGSHHDSQGGKAQVSANHGRYENHD